MLLTSSNQCPMKGYPPSISLPQPFLLRPFAHPFRRWFFFGAPPDIPEYLVTHQPPPENYPPNLHEPQPVSRVEQHAPKFVPGKNIGACKPPSWVHVEVIEPKGNRSPSSQGHPFSHFFHNVFGETKHSTFIMEIRGIKKLIYKNFRVDTGRSIIVIYWVNIDLQNLCLSILPPHFNDVFWQICTSTSGDLWKPTMFGAFFAKKNISGSPSFFFSPTVHRLTEEKHI